VQQFTHAWPLPFLPVTPSMALNMVAGLLRTLTSSGCVSQLPVHTPKAWGAQLCAPVPLPAWHAPLAESPAPDRGGEGIDAAEA
jgi:hypothetical protein